MVIWNNRPSGTYSVAVGNPGAIVREIEPGKLWRWWIYRESVVVAKGRTKLGMDTAKSLAAKSMEDY